MIYIAKNGNADSRTAKKDLTIDDLHEATTEHVGHVIACVEMFSNLLNKKVQKHDGTKFSAMQLFYDNMKDSIDNGTNFTKSEWYQMHIRAERHHPLSYCHKDISLIDIIEMIADCVCAGLARNGEYKDVEIPNEILQNAVKNTAKFFVENIIVSK